MQEGECTSCKEAQRAYSKKYALENSARIIEYRRTHKIDRRVYHEKRDGAYRKFIQDYKIERGCVDCGYKGHPAALDFDHLGDKEFQISSPPNRADKERILREIAKCEIVCANCHRIRTVNRQKPKLEDDDPTPGEGSITPEAEVTPEL